MTKVEQKQCPYDKSWFTPTRTNQIYASPANQIAHKNQKAREARERTENIDKAQKKNYAICKSLLEDIKEPKKFSKDFLMGCGFNFNVFNRISRIDDRSVPCVYEYYFYEIEKEKFKIGIDYGKL